MQKPAQNAEKMRCSFGINSFLRIVLTLAAIMSALLMYSTAFAQCSKDTECKGDRICVAGECVSPEPQGQPQAAIQQPTVSGNEPQAVSNPPNTYSNSNTYQHQENPYPYQQQPYPYQLQRPLSKGWAIPGGALGIVFSIPALVLGIKSEIIREDMIAVAYGSAATAIMAIWTPLAFAAGKSARRSGDPRVRGVVGLRITGWITYGLSMASAVALIALGISEITPPSGYIAATTVFGVASMLCMSIDAIVSGAQAAKAIRQDAVSNQHYAESKVQNKKEIQWTVTASPLLSDRGGIAGAALGVAGIF